MSTERITKNVLFNYIGVFSQIAIAFFLTPFLVNTLGDEKYGIWSIAAAFTGYMSLLDLGLSSAVNRYVSKYSSINDYAAVNQIVSSALVLFLCVSTFVVLVSPWAARAIVSTMEFDSSLTHVVYVLVIVVSFDVAMFLIGNLFRGIYCGLQRYDSVNIVRILSAVYKAVLFYVLLTSGFDLVAMGWVAVSANTLAVIALMALMRWQARGIGFSVSAINTKTIRKILSFSRFSFLAMLANQIIYYSDAFVIGYFMTAAAVAYYSIPWSLSEYTKRMCLAVSGTFAPAVSAQESTKNMQGVVDLYISGTRAMLVISNLICIGVMFFGGDLIALWIGPEYRTKCVAVLLILFANQLVMGPQMVSYAVLQGLSLQKTYSYVSIAVSIVNLGLSILLVRSYGIVGVAFGAAAPQILFYGIFVPLHTTKKIGLSFREYFRRTYGEVIFPTLGLVAVLYAISVTVEFGSLFDLVLASSGVAIIFLALVYAFMLWPSERARVRRALRLA